MSDGTFVLWGVKFATEEWGPLTGNFLIMSGIALTLYIALFFGNDEKVAEKASTEAKSPAASSRKRAESAAKPTSPAPETKAAPKAKSEATTPKAKAAAKPKAEPTTPKSTKKAAAAAPTPRSRSSTPNKRASKKNADADLGHILSPDGRRSSRLRSKTPGGSDE